MKKKAEITFTSDFADVLKLPKFHAIRKAARTNRKAAVFLDDVLMGARAVLSVCRPTLAEFQALSEIDRGALLLLAGVIQ